ncbi:endonuclease [Terrihabitans soli]|uniref:Endonuclease n=1 Tax=Terrihabitans soli TaxID=708113 RepID=A0A6S6QPD9_9HYPH|nr:GIY-YIG nuclease family protein [Terrihabitans soli]BCJ91336.1 endonuclease [Terrihabitans soli]
MPYPGAQVGRYWVYILASKRLGTLYVGATNNLARRVYEHREGLVPGFTKAYDVKLLVYAEEFASIADAREAEARIKKWRRAWKIELIERSNANWDDLYPSLI